MDWTSLALILFSATAVNHLGLVAAVEKVVRHRLPVLNCPKCLTFWSVLAYGGLSGDGIAAHPSVLPWLVAAALACAYMAIWLELIMYAIDTLYNRIYGKIEYYDKEDGTGETDG